MSNKSSLRGNLILLGATLLILIFAGEMFSRYYLSRTAETNKELTIYQSSDSLGWELLPGATAIHGPGVPPPKIEINSLGMRDSEISSEISIEKPKNTVRIAILGDSFTFGMIVDQQKIFPALLEKKMNQELAPKTKKKYEVLNFGTIGYGTDQYYLQLKNKVLKFSPDVVVLAYFAGNDATELRGHNWTLDATGDLTAIYDIFHIVTPDHQLRRRQAGVAFRSALYAFFREKGKVMLSKLGFPVQQPRLLWSNFLAPEHPWGDPDINEYYKKTLGLLKKIETVNRRNNIQTLIMLIPADIQVKEKYFSKYAGGPSLQQAWSESLYQTRPQKILHEYAQTEKVPLLDLLPEFRAEPEKDFYFEKDDTHFSPVGHEKTARLLLQKLSELDWL